MSADDGAATGGTRRTDALVSLAVGLGTLLLYWRTLLPHLGGTEDTPKFQYLGAVLGTAHSPGYPLYVLVSHLFSYLPIGTLAYRINLLSAVFGAVAVAMAYLIARRLGAHRIVAVAMSLAFAAGRLFWANALIAEVYTLNAVIWAGAILKLVDWTRSGRDRDLYWATAFVALGLGHHLTIVTIGPAVLALLIVSGRHWISARRIATCTAILLAGLTPYALIWIRTAQGANHMESRASNLRELLAVMTARRYSDLMFTADANTLITGRLPELLTLFRLELGIAGVLAAIAGAAVLAWNRPAPAALLVASIIGMLALTANVTGDAGGFLLPAYLMAWLLASAGIEGLRSAVAARLGGAAALVVAVAACALSVWQVAGNFATRDQSQRTFETRYFEALFRQVPPDAAVAIEDYWPEHMIRYATVSGDFGRPGAAPALVRPDPEAVERLLDRGVDVIAFPSAIGPLRGRGFRFVPLQLRGPAIAEYVAALPPDLLVAGAAAGVGVPAQVARALDGRVARWAGPAPSAAFVGVTGQASSLVADGPPGGFTLDAGEVVGSSGTRLPFPIAVSVDRNGAFVAIEGQEAVRVDAGVALVVVDQAGAIVDVQRFVPAEGFASALDMREWPLATVMRGGACTAAGDGTWHDVTSLSARSMLDIRVDNYAEFDSEVTVYAVSSKPLRPEMTNFFPGCHDPAARCPALPRPEPSIESRAITDAADLERVSALAAADGLVLRDGIAAVGQHVSKIQVPVNDRGQYILFALRLNGIADRVFAQVRLDDPNPRRASVCELVVPGLFAGGETTRLIDLRGDPVTAFGEGWHQAESAGPEAFRWTGATDARLLMPVDRLGNIRVTVEARGLELPEPQTFGLAVNGTLAGDPTPLGPAWNTFEWVVPASLWRAEANEVVLRVSRVERPAALAASGDDRTLGAAIRSIRFSLVTP